MSSSLLHIDPNSESWDVNISLSASLDNRKMKRDHGVLESKKEFIKRGIIRHTCCEGENGKKESNLSREMKERAAQREKK